MDMRPLGNTDLQVSALCLGTMTWGEQNTAAEAFEQLDYAIAQGINFIDTAEMYAVPTRAATSGATETILGQWLTRRGQRDDLVLATKITGPGDWLPHIRGGKTRFTLPHLEDALHGSLRRLQTDYIDLYQLHWPARSTNFFGRLGYQHRDDDWMTPIEDTLEALDTLVRAGKIRHIGLSNETPWGAMTFLKVAEQRGWPRIVSIQNPYSLLNRSFEVGLAEVAHREQVGLLAYSPLAFGMLSGKYLNNNWPEHARLTLFKQFSRYTNPQAIQATEAYVATAQEAGLDPAQMALAFVTQQPFVTSNIIGATTMTQLRSNIDSHTVHLDKAIIKALNDIHVQHPNPSP